MDIDVDASVFAVDGANGTGQVLSQESYPVLGRCRGSARRSHSRGSIPAPGRGRGRGGRSSAVADISLF